MGEDAQVELVDMDSASIDVVMPSARNGWIIGLGLGVGAPWLVLAVVGTVAAIAVAPPPMRRNLVLGAFIVHVLLGLLHVLAVSGVWLAVYSLSGTERLTVSPDSVVVRRKAAGLRIPIRTGRTSYDRVELLDQSAAPGRGPHPRIEIRAGHSAVRFGAGITASQAEELVGLIRPVLRGMGG